MKGRLLMTIKRGDKVEITGGAYLGERGEIWCGALPGMLTVAIPGHIRYPNIFIEWLKPLSEMEDMGLERGAPDNLSQGED